MFARLFLALTEYGWFRRLAWKPIYQFLAKKFSFADWHFMNYGYAPLDGSNIMELKEEDELNRFSIQLYHHLATQTEIAGKDVLEVGSGRGGGSSYIMRYLKPRSMTGMDLASNAVNFSNNTHKVEGLRYITGNAESIPLPDNNFDVVVNVESCHAYGSVPNFLKEVKRVLRPGGWFVCTDMRDKTRIDMLEGQMKDSGMNLVRTINVSPNVVKAIELEEVIKIKRIDDKIPPKYRNMFKEFAGVKGSAIHTGVRDGNLVYKHFVMQKG